MTITPIVPAPTRLAGDLAAAEEAVALAVASAEEAGEEAQAFTRVAVTVKSKEAVDKLAKQWGVPARWSMHGVIYLASKSLGGRSAEVEVVYYPPAKQNGAAA